MPTISKGVTYHLPKSFYRMTIGGGDSLKIEVAQEIQPDDVSFRLDISRNPFVDRVQNYGISPKGLLVTAKSEDTGRVTEILQTVASTIVAFGRAGMHGDLFDKANRTHAEENPESKSNNQLSAAEYAVFISELAKLNYKFTAPAGASEHKKPVPSSSGNFLMDFKAPSCPGSPLGAQEIREKLIEAGSRVKPGASRGVDDEILAAGVIARPITYGNVSYLIYVRKEAVNRLRDGGAKTAEMKSKSKLDSEKSEFEKNNGIAGEADKEITKLKDKIGEAEALNKQLEANGTASETLLEEIQANPPSAKAKLIEFHKHGGKFNRSDEYWTKYGEVLDTFKADGTVAEGGEKALFTKAIAFNTTVQKLVNEAVKASDEKIAVHEKAISTIETTKAQWEKNKLSNQDKINAFERDLEVARSASSHATIDIPIVVAEDRLPVVDQSHAQVIPLRRSMIDKVTSDVTLVDGVVTAHAVNEPSEVLGTVKIPLKVVESILDTASSLWGKKKAGSTAEQEYFEAEKKLLDARAALEAAREAQKSAP